MNNEHRISIMDDNEYDAAETCVLLHTEFAEIEDEFPWEILSTEMNNWADVNVLAEVYSDR